MIANMMPIIFKMIISIFLKVLKVKPCLSFVFKDFIIFSLFGADAEDNVKVVFPTGVFP